jgi:hypothetical protein
MPRPPDERATPLLEGASSSLRGASSSAPPGVHEWLQGHGLEQYLHPLMEAGYSSMRFVRDMDESDIALTIDECKMPRPHAKAFRAAIAAERGDRPPSTAPDWCEPRIAEGVPVVHAEPALSPAPVPSDFTQESSGPSPQIPIRVWRLFSSI